MGHLWIQERASAGEVVYRKVRGELNPADLMTKSLPATKVTSFSQELAQFCTDGHASARLALSTVSTVDRHASVAESSRSGAGDSGHGKAHGRGGVLDSACIYSYDAQPSLPQDEQCGRAAAGS